MAKERPKLNCRCSAPGNPVECEDKCERLCAKIISKKGIKNAD